MAICPRISKRMRYKFAMTGEEDKKKKKTDKKRRDKMLTIKINKNRKIKEMRNEFMEEEKQEQKDEKKDE